MHLTGLLLPKQLPGGGVCIISIGGVGPTGLLGILVAPALPELVLIPPGGHPLVGTQKVVLLILLLPTPTNKQHLVTHHLLFYLLVVLLPHLNCSPNDVLLFELELDFLVVLTPLPLELVAVDKCSRTRLSVHHGFNTCIIPAERGPYNSFPLRRLDELVSGWGYQLGIILI